MLTSDYAGPSSSYDEEGILTTELTLLSELRLVTPSPQATMMPSATADQTDAAASAMPIKTVATTISEATVNATDPLQKITTDNQSEAAAAAADALQAEQSSTHQPGADAVPRIGAWADLSNQIARRKAELASKAGGSSDIAKSTAANGVHSTGAESVVSEHKVMKVTGMQTPGAARPRGGVRASAMGPMLAFLRSSGGLGGSEA